MQIKYSDYIGEIVAEIPFGVPFFNDDIVSKLSSKTGLSKLKIKDVVNLNLKRYADEKIIERIQKGAYYKPKMTAFGKTKPPTDLAIAKMCTEHSGEVIGYIGADTLLNDLGLSTLIPKIKVIVTNKYRVKIPNDTNIILKKPVTRINDDNVKYLKVIDAIAMIDNSFIDVKNPNEIILRIIEKYKLDKLNLLRYAKKYYSNKVLLMTLDIILAGNNEIT